MRRRPSRVAVTALIATLALVLGACGVPSSGPPVIDGNASGGGAGLGVTPMRLPDGPAGASLPTDLVTGYLSAIAGQTEPDSATAKGALKAFMTDAEARRWRASTTVQVLHQIGDLRETPDQNETQVDGSFQVLGLLSLSDGTLESLPAGMKTRLNLTFHVTGQLSGPPPDGGNASAWRFSDAPDGVYISDAALVKYYAAHSVYFWDTSDKILVPELRYIPQTISEIQAETQVVDWVLAGPSNALSGATKRLVNTTLVDPQVQVEDDRIIVDLAPTANFTPDEQRLLGNQLRWSLLGMGPKTGTIDPPPVDIYVDRQEQMLVDDEAKLRQANPVSQRQIPVTEFAINRNGVVRTIDGSEAPVLTSRYNTNVRIAAVNSNQTAAALVRPASGGGMELWVRRTADKAHDFVRVLTAKSIARPVWMPQPAGALALVVDGKLTFLDARNNRVPAQISGIGPIKAISVSPEGRRIALVTDDGGLYTTALTWSSVPVLQAARALHPWYKQAAVRADAVAWSKTDQLAVGGQWNGRNQLFEVNSDGSNTTTLSEPFQLPITQVAAYPLDGRIRSDIGPVVFQTGPDARRVRPAEGTDYLDWAPGTKASGDGAPTFPFFPD
jgi:hypothetical protein